jgi:hypothetical protein
MHFLISALVHLIGLQRLTKRLAYARLAELDAAGHEETASFPRIAVAKVATGTKPAEITAAAQAHVNRFFLQVAIVPPAPLFKPSQVSALGRRRTFPNLSF